MSEWPDQRSDWVALYACNGPGPPAKPEVFAALRWHTDDGGEWSVGTHIGTLPAAVRRYYDDLTDIDEDLSSRGSDSRGHSTPGDRAQWSGADAGRLLPLREPHLRRR
jgi:hypothetical protein